jgi:hypothetical protein
MGVMPGVECLALFVGASSGMQPLASADLFRLLADQLDTLWTYGSSR